MAAKLTRLTQDSDTNAPSGRELAPGNQSGNFWIHPRTSFFIIDTSALMEKINQFSNCSLMWDRIIWDKSLEILLERVHMIGMLNDIQYQHKLRLGK
jgi:hypothetical protein